MRTIKRAQKLIETIATRVLDSGAVIEGNMVEIEDMVAEAEALVRDANQLAAKDQRIAELELERSAWQPIAEYREVLVALDIEKDRLIMELEAALKPFADAWPSIKKDLERFANYDPKDDTYAVTCVGSTDIHTGPEHTLYSGDFKRAAEVLKKSPSYGE